MCVCVCLCLCACSLHRSLTIDTPTHHTLPAAASREHPSVGIPSSAVRCVTGSKALHFVASASAGMMASIRPSSGELGVCVRARLPLLFSSLPSCTSGFCVLWEGIGILPPHLLLAPSSSQCDTTHSCPRTHARTHTPETPENGHVTFTYSDVSVGVACIRAPSVSQSARLYACMSPSENVYMYMCVCVCVVVGVHIFLYMCVLSSCFSQTSPSSGTLPRIFS